MIPVMEPIGGDRLAPGSTVSVCLVKQPWPAIRCPAVAVSDDGTHLLGPGRPVSG